MIYEKPAPDLGSGMNLDAGKKPPDMGDQSTEKEHLVSPEPPAGPVKKHRMEPRITEEDLKHASGRRVPFKN